MNYDYGLTPFTPSEAERITGLTTDMQRDWRRRNVLQEQEGHARFDGFGLGPMFFLKRMSERGFGPQQASEFAYLAGAAIFYGALQREAAYEGNELIGGPPFRSGSVIRKKTKKPILKRLFHTGFSSFGQTVGTIGLTASS